MSGYSGSYGIPASNSYGAMGQFAPQGLFGNILGSIAGPVGGAIGGLFGNQQLGQRIGSTAGQFANFLPFAAGPQAGMVGQQQQQQPELDPQFLNGLVNLIRQAASAVQQGAQVINAIHQAAPGLLPFALGPQAGMPQQQPQQATGDQQQQIAPQGLFGNILGSIAGPVGGAIGGLFGNHQLGQRIGNTAGQFANFLPFAAGPQAGQSYLH